MTDHFVRHMLQSDGYGVATEFMCKAAFGAFCRLLCDRCNRLQREQCECMSEDLSPDMQDQGECLLLVWFEQTPDELYNGEPTPVRGPDWQPITPEWNGDTWEWDYAND